jgi:FkbM family methyltransferase
MLRIDRPESPYWFPQGVHTRFTDRFQQDGSEPWLRSRMQQLLAQRPGSVISAGCYVGGLVYWLSQWAERVWTWDAVEEHVDCTQRMLDHNSIQNVTLAHRALGDTAGTAHVTTGCQGSEHLGGASSLVIDNNAVSPHLDLSTWTLRTQQVEQIRLDDLDFPNLSILQLDLEGSEHLALTGATRTVETHNPIIIIENNPSADSLVRSWGYTVSESRAGDTIYTR